MTPTGGDWRLLEEYGGLERRSECHPAEYSGSGIVYNWPNLYVLRPVTEASRESCGVCRPHLKSVREDAV